MCGIIGYLAAPGRIPDIEAVRSSLEAIRHRGPDDSGLVMFDPPRNALSVSKGNELNVNPGTVGLGATRLSILDLSQAAHQPLVDDEHRYVVVYNGEIYNYRELRRELEAAGHRFRSSGDTEVLLRAYQTWGKDCLARFEGMFAFAILDVRRQLLFLARDPFVIKPLYYTEEGGFISRVNLAGCSDWPTARGESTRAAWRATWQRAGRTALIKRPCCKVFGGFPRAAAVQFSCTGAAVS